MAFKWPLNGQQLRQSSHDVSFHAFLNGCMPSLKLLLHAPCRGACDPCVERLCDWCSDSKGTTALLREWHSCSQQGREGSMQLGAVDDEDGTGGEEGRYGRCGEQASRQQKCDQQVREGF